MRRRVFLHATFLLALSVAIPSEADNRLGMPDVIVAVIDTGIRATHQEFDFRGASSEEDQLVGWWDFTADPGEVVLPGYRDTWDPRVAPNDPVGHGTGTASLLVGSGRDPNLERSFAPGYKLAVAKVGDQSGIITGDLGTALTWAVDTIHADVVNMSLSAGYPIPEVLRGQIHELAGYARRQGVLVVVSNGNGWFNAALVPGQPGWATAYGDSTNVLAVGAEGAAGYRVRTDPEVTARFENVVVASSQCDSCYATKSGTSFSAPLVGGMAARIIRERVLQEDSSSPDYVERLLKFSARDTVVPPPYEGYGVLDAERFAIALEHGRLGTVPERPSPDLNAIYVEEVAGTLRDLWVNKLDSEAKIIYSAGVQPGTGQGVIGPSLPVGTAEAEFYDLHLSTGDLLLASAELVASDPVGMNDLELMLFEGTALPLTGDRLVARSRPQGNKDLLSFTAGWDDVYTLVVLGWLVNGYQPYAMLSTPTVDYRGEGYVLHSFAI